MFVFQPTWQVWWCSRWGGQCGFVKEEPTALCLAFSIHPSYPDPCPLNPGDCTWGLLVQGPRRGRPRGLQVWFSGWAAWAAAFHFQTPGRKGCLWPAICLHKRNLRISSSDRTRSLGFQRVALNPVPTLATKLWSLTQPDGHSGN